MRAARQLRRRWRAATAVSPTAAIRRKRHHRQDEASRVSCEVELEAPARSSTTANSRSSPRYRAAVESPPRRLGPPEARAARSPESCARFLTRRMLTESTIASQRSEATSGTTMPTAAAPTDSVWIGICTALTGQNRLKQTVTWSMASSVSATTRSRAMAPFAKPPIIGSPYRGRRTSEPISESPLLEPVRSRARSCSAITILLTQLDPVRQTRRVTPVILSVA